MSAEEILSRLVECEDEDGGQSLTTCLAEPDQFCVFHHSFYEQREWLRAQLLAAYPDSRALSAAADHTT